MVNKLKIAIAGLDSFFFSRMFAKHLAANPSAELVGCATLGVDDESIMKNCGLTPEQYAEEFRIPVFGDIGSVLEETGAEAVVLTTRPSAMPGVLGMLAERDVHIYVAKPVCVSEEGLAQLESLAAGGRVFSAGPTARFDPVIREAQAKVAGGEIGAVTSIRVMHQHGMLKFWPGECWYYEEKEGGIESFLAWYCLDLLRWFTGLEVDGESLQGVAANLTDRGSPHADVLKAVCSLGGGKSLGSFDVLFNVSWPYPMFELEIIGTKGALRIQQDAYEGKLFTADGGTAAFGRRLYDSLPDELDDWVTACLGRKEAAMPWEDAVAVVRASLALRRRLNR